MSFSSGPLDFVVDVCPLLLNAACKDKRCEFDTSWRDKVGRAKPLGANSPDHELSRDSLVFVFGETSTSNHNRLFTFFDPPDERMV